MDTVAVLVDGGFFLRCAKRLWNERSPKDMAELLHRYCTTHLMHSENGEQVRDRLYRIFYYDCPPMDRNVYHPLLQRDKSMKKEPLYAWMTEFQEELRSKRKVALRMGRLSDNGVGYTLPIDVVKKLCTGSLKVEELRADDFRLNGLHKAKPEGARIRGQRTIAKEKLYKFIQKEIATIHPNFNIGVSTGAHGRAYPHWNSPYEHWVFESQETKERRPTNPT